MFSLMTYLFKGPTFADTSKSAINTSVWEEVISHSCRTLLIQVSKLETEISITDVLSFYGFSTGVEIAVTFMNLYQKY